MNIVDRYEAETRAWEGFVGSHTPEEFMEISRDQGCVTAEDAVNDYVKSLPDLMGPDAPKPGEPLFDNESGWKADDLPDLLLGYIQRKLPDAS